MRAKLLTAVLVVVLSACQLSTVPDVPTAAGRWTGIGTSGLFTIFEIFLQLEEDPTGRLTGTAQLTSPGRPSFDFVLRNGAHGHPDILVSLFSPNNVDVNYSGRFVSPDSITGLLNGSGFNNVPLSIRRQR